jgi:uncharacterized protein YprB with RNaseH-like and TPR domain
VSTLADRLRGVLRTPPPPAPVTSVASGGCVEEILEEGREEDCTGTASAASARRARLGTLADILGGEWDDRDLRRFATIDRRYLPGHRHGRVAMADGLPPTGGWARLHLLAGEACGERLLFVDLETTGLAGGAGTQAFLVGCAWFDGGSFRIRQFLLTSPSGERAMLEAVATMANGCDAVVTYNGKSFDLPLMETRFLFQRMPTPFAGKPHVDMVHPARRLWRTMTPARLGGGGANAGRGGPFPPPVHVDGASGCRLSELERTLCGHTREDDVPGFEIPGRYFHYVRTGDASVLRGVLEHNRLDLISLALVTARAAQMLEAGPSGDVSTREAYGLGRLYERGGLTREARECFGLAARAEAQADEGTRAEALRALAVIARRERQYEEAATAWRAVLDLPRCPANIAREAAEALAVHHEHRLRDPRVAHGFALQSLESQESRTGRAAIERRLARLCRKMGEAPSAGGSPGLPEFG